MIPLQIEAAPILARIPVNKPTYIRLAGIELMQNDGLRTSVQKNYR